MTTVNHQPQPARLPSLTVLVRMAADLKREPYPVRSRFGSTARMSA